MDKGDALLLSVECFPQTVLGLTVGTITRANGFEFVEIQNTSSNLVYLTGVSFIEGINFAFADGTSLAPGAFAVVVANAAAFSQRYPGVPVAGQFVSGKLDNGGERLTLAYWMTNVLFTVRYDNTCRGPSPPPATV
jgi:hypothetical protein